MHKPLIGLGFWRSLLEPNLPDPAWFVKNWQTASKQAKVLQYLRQGQPKIFWMGYSWCRFRCGVATSGMGTADLTDGTYCWPEGLAHYLEQHGVRLPDAFVDHVDRQASFPMLAATDVPEICAIDMTWWQQQQGWHTHVSSFSAATDEEEARWRARTARQQKLDSY